MSKVGWVWSASAISRQSNGAYKICQRIYQCWRFIPWNWCWCWFCFFRLPKVTKVISLHFLTLFKIVKVIAEPVVICLVSFILSIRRTMLLHLYFVL